MTETAVPESSPPQLASTAAPAAPIQQGKPSELFKAIARVALQASRVEKKGRVDSYQAKYTYLRAGDVVGALNQAMAEEGLVLIANEVSRELRDIRSKSGGEGAFAEVVMQYTIHHADSGECIGGLRTGTASDYPGDKAIYKAATGAKKNFLMDCFMIEPADEDDPESSSHEARSEAKPARQRKPAPEPGAQGSPSTASREPSGQAGNLTTGFAGGMGLRYNATQVAVKARDGGGEYAVFKLVDAKGEPKPAQAFGNFHDALADMGLPVEGSELVIEIGKTYTVNSLVEVAMRENKGYFNIDELRVLNPSPRGQQYREAKAAATQPEAQPAPDDDGPPPIDFPGETMPDFGAPLDMESDADKLQRLWSHVLYHWRRTIGIGSDEGDESVNAKTHWNTAYQQAIQAIASQNPDVESNAWILANGQSRVDRMREMGTKETFPAGKVPFLLADAEAWVKEFV